MTEHTREAYLSRHDLRDDPPNKPQIAHIGALVQVVWLDSQHDIGQVDSEDLPNPSQLESAGYLSASDDAHVVISRDRSPGPNSFEWRANLAIPRIAIVRMDVLSIAGEITEVGHQAGMAQA